MTTRLSSLSWSRRRFALQKDGTVQRCRWPASGTSEEFTLTSSQTRCEAEALARRRRRLARGRRRVERVRCREHGQLPGRLLGLDQLVAFLKGDGERLGHRMPCVLQRRLRARRDDGVRAGPKPRGHRLTLVEMLVERVGSDLGLVARVLGRDPIPVRVHLLVPVGRDVRVVARDKSG
jgi:hypothetical protein